MAHFNASDAYFGTYVRFQTKDKKEGVALTGPDNAVGDIGTVVWHTDENHRQQAWLKNPYDLEIGYLDAETSYKLAIYQAKNWEIRYVLSFVAYSDSPSPGMYWGEVALIAYNPRYAQQFEYFLKAFAQQAGEGLRPDPHLRPQAIESLINDPSSWKPSAKVKIPRNSGTSILKEYRTFHDKLLDQARRKNPGCYLISWIFIAAIIAGLVWVLHFLGLI